MPWFRAEALPDGQIKWEHWQWLGRGPKHDPDEMDETGRRDIASVFYPQIGPYDGRDPDVLEYHLLLAGVVGIDGFIADWYGPRTFSDDVFARLLAEAERRGAKAAICLEEKAFFPPYSEATTRADALDVAERHIRYVLQTYATSDAYLHIRSRPAFLLFVNHEQGALGRHTLSPDELRALITRLNGTIFFSRSNADAAYVGIGDSAFEWVGQADYRKDFYKATLAQNFAGTGASPYIIAAAVPGFDDTGVWGWGNGPRTISRNDGATYEEHWREAQEHNADAIQIVTWNDFQEGSSIEPAEPYGFQYLDQTEKWAGRLRHRPINLGDNEWPLRLYNLRRAISRLTIEADRVEWTGRVDRFVADMLNGRRLFMAFRLRRLEHQLQKLIENSGRINK